MALTAKLDTTKTPAEITVVSDQRRRPVKLIIEVAGESAVAVGEFPPYPITVRDEAGAVVKVGVKSDDGVTAILTLP